MNDISNTWLKCLSDFNEVVGVELTNVIDTHDHSRPVIERQQRAAALLIEMRSLMASSIEVVARHFAISAELRVLIGRARDLVDAGNCDHPIDLERERLLRMPPIPALDEVAARVAAACERMALINKEVAAQMDLGAQCISESLRRVADLASA